MSFCDARGFRNSGLFWGMAAQPDVPIKNGSSANCVCPCKTEVLCPSVSPSAGKKPGSPRSLSSALSEVQGKFHEYQGTWVKTVHTETY